MKANQTNNTTDRKAVEAALRESEDKYRFLFANNPQPMWIYDLETLAFLEVNQAAVNHYGYTSEEFLSMTIKDIRPRKDIDALLKNVEHSHEIYRHSGEWRHVKKNGEIIHVEITSHAITFNDRKARHVMISDISDFKQSEKALIKSEEKYRKLHQSMVDGFAYIDMKGKIREYNDSFKRLLGYNDEELSLLSLNDFTPEKWHDFEQKIIHEQILVRGYSDIYEKEYKKKDGILFPVEIHAFLLKNDAGENEGMWAIVRDITERKQAEKELVESRQQLLDIIDFLPDATFVVDNEKKVIAWNKAMEEMTGVQKRDMIGKGNHEYSIPFYGKKQKQLLDFLDTDDQELTNRYSDVVRKELSLHAEIFIPLLNNGKGAYISVLGAPLFNSDGERMGSIETIRDVTDRKKTEEALVKLNKAINNSGEAIFLTDREGIFTFVNPAFHSLYGFPPEEIIGKTTPRVFKSGLMDKLVYENFWMNLLEGNEVRGEWSNRRVNGAIIDIESSATPIMDGEQNIIGFLGIQRDITERKQAEQELIVAKEKAEESDRLKSAFLANMSHEVRTPLNSIIGFSELLADPHFGQEQKDEFIHLIVTNGNNLLTIISDIMDISKIESGEITMHKSQVDARKLIITVKERFLFQAVTKKLKLKLSLPDTPIETLLFTDADRLHQIFNNLINNALKFTEKGQIEIGYHCWDNLLEFFVRDTGIGISSEYHNKIFERFRQVESEKTRKYGGNGLGLAITKNLVELLGGKIWVESEPGRGSAFYFIIPCEPVKTGVAIF
jgi:PAS domain S-box-containing protein